MSAPGKRKLDFEEQEDMLAICERGLKSSKVSQKEADFLVDMATGYKDWGARMLVSEKQWNWLMAIGDKA